MSSHPAQESAALAEVPRSRKAAQISALLDRRLAAYALVAGAAAANTMAMGQTAEGHAQHTLANIPSENTIIYTAANIPFSIAVFTRGGPPPINLDLNSDGITDVGIQLGASGYSLGTEDKSYYQARASWFAPAGNGGVKRPIAAGIEIGPNMAFAAGGLLVRSVYSNRHGLNHQKNGCSGPFKNSAAYWGVKFLINGETHYGWVRISVGCSAEVVAGTVTGYAYETVPDQPIGAGQMHSGDAAKEQTATSATLGMLGLGSAGLPLWRP